MPVSERSEVGMSIWEPLCELVMVTWLATGAPSFSQVISGMGEAYNIQAITKNRDTALPPAYHHKWRSPVCHITLCLDYYKSFIFFMGYCHKKVAQCEDECSIKFTRSLPRSKTPDNYTWTWFTLNIDSNLQQIEYNHMTQSSLYITSSSMRLPNYDYGRYSGCLWAYVLQM